MMSQIYKKLEEQTPSPDSKAALISYWQMSASPILLGYAGTPS